MSDPCRNAERILGIGRKLVYLELFLLMMGASGYWHLPQTAPIVCGVLVLSATFLRFLNAEELESECAINEAECGNGGL